MKVKLHQDVLGHRSGDEPDVDGTMGEWLVAQGYASVESTTDGEGDGDKIPTGAEIDAGQAKRPDDDGLNKTDVEAKDDPTLSANREDPDDFDAAKTEDDADNDDASKLKDVEDARPERQGATTEKRKPKKAKGKVSDEGTQVYEGDDTPTAGPLAIPVDGDAPVPAVADLSTATKDSKADKA